MNKEYQRWLNSSDADKKIKKELYNIKGNEEEITSRFALPLSFGTAGLRGIMRAGINGMNVYTVSQATQGLANVIIASGGSQKGVACHDSRQLRLFAETAAEYLPIIILRFICLNFSPAGAFLRGAFHGCTGINITASQPKEYNGYKVY